MASIQEIKQGCYDEAIMRIYGCGSKKAEAHKSAILKTMEGYNSYFGKEDNFKLFSAPGRTEIGGNHTDHQHGRVLCGSVDLDVIAAVVPDAGDKIIIKSDGYDVDEVDIYTLDPIKTEENKSISLLRGIAAKFKDMGYTLSGFKAYVTSTVLKGSGLSSSAAFEILICNIFNSLFADGKVNPVQLAQIGQYAENVYFGKPCGLMDQMASSVGGVVTIDFENPSKPIVEKIDFNLSDYSLCIIDSNADHANLTDEYADISREMKSVAQYFGKEVLREVDRNEFYDNIAEIRRVTGDRAILRAEHFFAENERVPLQVKALKDNDINEFNRITKESGRSSYMYLQNVYAACQPQNQAVSVVLCECDRLLGEAGAYRVHGGGFAGTVQAFVPNETVEKFKIDIEKIVGKGKCYILNIRPIGGTEIR